MYVVFAKCKIRRGDRLVAVGSDACMPTNTSRNQQASAGGQPEERPHTIYMYQWQVALAGKEEVLYERINGTRKKRELREVSERRGRSSYAGFTSYYSLPAELEEV